MPRYKLTLEYDGTGFAGWQRQEGIPSVQALLEDALLSFACTKVTAHAAGRTDKGVHATGQVVHVDIEKDHTAETVRRALNFYLYETALVVKEVKIVDPEFHARFSAIQRSYMYRIINRLAPLALERERAWHIRSPLDLDAMQEAAGYLLGHHDFTSFRAVGCQGKSPFKTMEEIRIEKEGEEIRFYVSAKSFLHHMVRNIVGTLHLVGHGKWTPLDVKRALEARDRKLAGPTAPAQGLYFTGVKYEGE